MTMPTASRSRTRSNSNGTTNVTNSVSVSSDQNDEALDLPTKRGT